MLCQCWAQQCPRPSCVVLHCKCEGSIFASLHYLLLQQLRGAVRLAVSCMHACCADSSTGRSAALGSASLLPHGHVKADQHSTGSQQRPSSWCHALLSCGSALSSGEALSMALGLMCVRRPIIFPSSFLSTIRKSHEKGADDFNMCSASLDRVVTMAPSQELLL